MLCNCAVELLNSVIGLPIFSQVLKFFGTQIAEHDERENRGPSKLKCTCSCTGISTQCICTCCSSHPYRFGDMKASMLHFVQWRCRHGHVCISALRVKSVKYA